MIRPSRLQPPNGPILNGEDGQALVKSPGSYTSPDTTKPSLFGNGIVSGREKSVDMDYSHMDPDDMFARYSVSEIRAIRSRLLLDADGKREELRQMVGERYRDLLHASTAITNMAGTSERVVATLIDMRESCAGILLLDESPRTRHRSIPNGKTTKAQEDAHLKTLQTLSAHLKLLLDSPEHLWRWLEKKQFLHAAWLFLLARTVYRKLSKSPDEDESEEEEISSGDINWSRHGIDVMEQFPVASKQWEAIGQFRPQIVHKATQALRESNTSHRVYFIYQMQVGDITDAVLFQDTAETLIAILLLDALSTSRTRNLFLSQRSKTLTSLLNPPVSASRRAISPNRAQNRKATAALLSPAASPRSVPSPSVQLLKTPITPSAANAKAEKKTVREVVKAFRAVISLVAGTMAATRAIYGVNGLFTQIIMVIQAEVPSQNIPTTVSQAQLPMSNIIQPSTLTSRNLTTPQILYSLPSSSLLLRFLPPSITGYTPYVSTDAEGSDETKTGNTEGELNGWLTAALEALALPARNWLNKLDSVRAVWTVRGAVVKGIVALEGTKETKDRLLGAIEAAFIGRVLEVWETRLESIEIIVSNALRRAASLSEVSTSVDAKSQDINPLTFVYSSELPIVRTEPSGDSSFRLFESALKCRVNRRTPLLDLSLSEMEAAAQELRDELTITLGDDNTSEAGTRLTSSYQPRAADACMRIADAVSKALDDAATNDEQVKANVCVFIGRLANALAHHSNFIPNLSCSPDAATRARDIFGDVHKKSVDLWCKRSCEHALMIYRPEFEISPSRDINISSILRQSNSLTSALMALISSIDSFGMTLEEIRAQSISSSLLSKFSSLLVAGIPVEHAPNQVIWDLMFLKEMQRAREGQAKDTKLSQDNLSASIISSHFQKHSEDQQTVNTLIRDQLARSQLLFSTLLDVRIPQTQAKPIRTQNAFLPLGGPPTETDFHPALDLVKPCARFGMLPSPTMQAG
ncbi:Vps51/Vps67, partial [Rhizoctonia solani]